MMSRATSLNGLRIVRDFDSLFLSTKFPNCFPISNNTDPDCGLANAGTLSAGSTNGIRIHDAIVDSLNDDEERDDTGAALNRLEGRISQTQQVLKQSKVETWIESIQEGMVNGLSGDGKPRFPIDHSRLVHPVLTRFFVRIVYREPARFLIAILAILSSLFNTASTSPPLHRRSVNVRPRCVSRRLGRVCG